MYCRRSLSNKNRGREIGYLDIFQIKNNTTRCTVRHRGNRRDSWKGGYNSWRCGGGCQLVQGAIAERELSQFGAIVDHHLYFGDCGLPVHQVDPTEMVVVVTERILKECHLLR